MTVLHSLLQSISLAMNQGLMTQKKKKRKTVSIMTRGLPGSESQKKQQRADDKEEEAAQDGVEKSRRLQQDPLRGKIRDAMPEEYLHRASKWYGDELTALATTGFRGQILAMALVHAERALRIGRANLGSLAGSPLDGGDAPGPSELALCVV